MDPKLKIAKIATKLAVGVVGSVLIGYTIKGEKLITSAVEGYFENKSN